ncbi:hypothetical protein [Aliiruegeria lutimaris]|nr:hypothetical protein [Aliiruegeria lutimaris]
MSDQDHLASLRRAHIDIDFAILIDLRASTVLCVSSHIDQPQETLDALCRASSLFFGERFGDRSEFCLTTPLRTIVAHRVGPAGETALVVTFEPGVALGYARETTTRACHCLGG